MVCFFSCFLDNYHIKHMHNSSISLIFVSLHTCSTITLISPSTVMLDKIDVMFFCMKCLRRSRHYTVYRMISFKTDGEIKQLFSLTNRIAFYIHFFLSHMCTCSSDISNSNQFIKKPSVISRALQIASLLHI